MNTRWGTVVMAVTALSLLTVSKGSAQRPGRGGPAWDSPGPRGGGVVERVLSMRDELELTEDQVARLDRLRMDALTRSAEMASRLMRLRSDFRAGEISAEAFREGVAQQREEARSGWQERRGEVEEVLTQEQLDQLADMGRMGRRMRRGDTVGPWGLGPGCPRCGFRGGRAYRWQRW